MQKNKFSASLCGGGKELFSSLLLGFFREHSPAKCRNKAQYGQKIAIYSPRNPNYNKVIDMHPEATDAYTAGKKEQDWGSLSVLPYPHIRNQ
jgi:hypothetical protein